MLECCSFWVISTTQVKVSSKGKVARCCWQIWIVSFRIIFLITKVEILKPYLPLQNWTEAAQDFPRSLAYFCHFWDSSSIEELPCSFQVSSYRYLKALSACCEPSDSFSIPHHSLMGDLIGVINTGYTIICALLAYLKTKGIGSFFFFIIHCILSATAGTLVGYWPSFLKTSSAASGTHTITIE